MPNRTDPLRGADAEPARPAPSPPRCRAEGDDPGVAEWLGLAAGSEWRTGIAHLDAQLAATLLAHHRVLGHPRAIQAPAKPIRNSPQQTGAQARTVPDPESLG